MLLTIIVLDSVGVGALPDAAAFGDAGAHTLNHTLEAAPVPLPNLTRLGLGLIPTVLPNPAALPSGKVKSVEVKSVEVKGGFGRMREVSLGKDTSTGHWEFMGIQLQHAFQIFPDGFPPIVMDRFSAGIGRSYLCNKPYSGTDVIKDYGEEHLKTGCPIVYTSGDSVFQIAAHEDIISVDDLYEWCRVAREILQGEYAVARVIARPFKGTYPFERANEHRKDFSLVPPPTVLDAVKATGQAVVGIGKIPDIYANQGFTEAIHTDDNADGIQKTLAKMKQANAEGTSGLIFTNLVDFDSKYGHRRDPVGYSHCLGEFDAALPEILANVPQDGVLLIVSDHGNDPTWHGSDHTREHAMLLAYHPQIAVVNLGERATFADVGATAADMLGANWDGAGESFWGLLR